MPRGSPTASIKSLARENAGPRLLMRGVVFLSVLSNRIEELGADWGPGDRPRGAFSDAFLHAVVPNNTRAATAMRKTPGARLWLAPPELVSGASIYTF